MSWHSEGRLVSPAEVMGEYRGKLRCPWAHDVRDWLHRLDAKGCMRGDQLSASLGRARGEYVGFFESDHMAEKILARLEALDWIRRLPASKGGYLGWEPSARFNLRAYEEWRQFGCPHAGDGMIPPEVGAPLERL